MYREYDKFIAGTEIFDNTNKLFNKTQKELLELITNDINEDRKYLLTQERQLFKSVSVNQGLILICIEMR